MSFLSVLGKIAPFAALAIPGIGPALGMGAKAIAGTSGVLSGIGKVASGAAKGSADQRLAEGGQALTYAQLAQQAARDKALSDLSGANAQFGAGLQGAQFQREGQDRQRKSALLSSYLGNVQDVNITGMNPKIAARTPTITGGLRPSAFTGGGGREALMALLAQPEVDAPAYQAPSPYVSPGMPLAPKAGVGEKVLGGVGLGANILSLLGAIPRREMDLGFDNPYRVGTPPYVPGMGG